MHFRFRFGHFLGDFLYAFLNLRNFFGRVMHHRLNRRRDPMFDFTTEGLHTLLRIFELKIEYQRDDRDGDCKSEHKGFHAQSIYSDHGGEATQTEDCSS